MKLRRHQSHSLVAELKEAGLSNWRFPTHIQSAHPSPGSRIVQVTSMYRLGSEALLYFDEHGAFLNQKIFSPYECTFIEDLPYKRPKVLGSINLSMPLKTLTAFLISADIIRTLVNRESHMLIHQVHSKLVKVHGYYSYFDRVKHVVPFGFSVSVDAFRHVCVCRHSVKNIVDTNPNLGKAC